MANTDIWPWMALGPIVDPGPNFRKASAHPTENFAV